MMMMSRKWCGVSWVVFRRPFEVAGSTHRCRRLDVPGLAMRCRRFSPFRMTAKRRFILVFERETSAFIGETCWNLPFMWYNTICMSCSAVSFVGKPSGCPGKKCPVLRLWQATFFRLIHLHWRSSRDAQLISDRTSAVFEGEMNPWGADAALLRFSKNRASPRSSKGRDSSVWTSEESFMVWLCDGMELIWASWFWKYHSILHN